MAQKRLRVAGLVVTPILLWDDGETLSAGPQVQPIKVEPADLDVWPATFRTQLARLEAEILETDSAE